MNIGTPTRPLRVAVVGAGPAGFYAAGALLDAGSSTGATGGLAVEVDLLDRLPTPFGLVRGGVAPDHQKIKKVTAAFEKIAARPGFRFFGNVRLGADVSVAELLRHYDQVCLSVGTEGGQPLDVPGVDLAGSAPAPEFVAWYNAHPDHAHRTYDLGPSAAVVVGVGNVALDVARILVRSVDELATTDIGSRALAALRTSGIRDVTVLGRRGPVQAAFTPGELKDIAALDGVDVVVPPWSAEVDPASAAWLAAHGTKADRAKVDLIRELSLAPSKGAARRMHLHLHSSPTALIGEGGRVVGVRVERNVLTDDGRGGIACRGTGQFTDVRAGLVVAAVGYRGAPIPGVPFDARKGVVTNEGGRVVDQGVVVPGLYVAGWAKRGPSGVIGTNKADAVDTVARMLEDARSGACPAAPAPDPLAAEALLGERARPLFTWAHWQRLDQVEREAGEAAGRVRTKLEHLDEMVAALESKVPATAVGAADGAGAIEV